MTSTNDASGTDVGLNYNPTSNSHIQDNNDLENKPGWMDANADGSTDRNRTKRCKGCHHLCPQGVPGFTQGYTKFLKYRSSVSEIVECKISRFGELIKSLDCTTYNTCFINIRRLPFLKFQWKKN